VPGDAVAIDPPPPPCVRRRAGRDVWRGWRVHQFGSPELPEPSTLPVGDSTDMGKGYSDSQLNVTLDLCVNVLVRPDAYFAAPVTQGPQGRVVSRFAVGKLE
jgi:hypothetical protein